VRTATGEVLGPLNTTFGGLERLATCAALGPWQDSQPAWPNGACGSPDVECGVCRIGSTLASVLWHFRQVCAPPPAKAGGCTAVAGAAPCGACASAEDNPASASEQESSVTLIMLCMDGS
jgi:hypothetical protein